MDRVMTKDAQTGSFTWPVSGTDTSNIYTLEHGNCTSLELAVQARLVLYIRDIGDRNPSRIYQKRPRPLLDHALQVARATLSSFQFTHKKGLAVERELAHIDHGLVYAILRCGVGPNEPIAMYGAQKPWERFVMLSCGCGKIWDHTVSDDYLGAVQCLVEYWADLDQSIRLAEMEAKAGMAYGWLTAFYGRMEVPARDVLAVVFPRERVDVELEGGCGGVIGQRRGYGG